MCVHVYIYTYIQKCSSLISRWKSHQVTAQHPLRRLPQLSNPCTISHTHGHACTHASTRACVTALNNIYFKNCLKKDKLNTKLLEPSR